MNRRCTHKPAVDSSALVKMLGHDELFRSRVEAAGRVLDFLIQAKERMQQLGIDQSELGRRIGVGRSQVNRWLHDESGLNAKSMFLIARALGFDLSFEWRPHLEFVDTYQEYEARTLSSEVSSGSTVVAETIEDVPLKVAG